MSNTELISNKKDSNHLDYILKCFKDADEIWIATAFLKNSGLDLLLPSIKKHISLNKPIHIITGQNFGLTDPNALRVLHHLFEKKINADFYLDKAEIKTKTFHPKLFAFKNKGKAIIISGSANVTKGGLTNNTEVSISVETNTSNSDWNAVISYFTEITSDKNSDAVTLVIIKRYEQYFIEQKKLRDKQKAGPEKKSSEYSFDYTKLKERLKEIRNEEYLEKLKLRIKNYNKAKQLLDEIADSKALTQKRFEEIIDTLVGKEGLRGLWKSGSLLRLRFEVYQCKNEFCTLVRFIKNNQKISANKIFTQAKILVKDIHGAGINYVAEIMMTYQPDRLANLNSNPIKVLKEEAGVYFKSHSSSFNGEDYGEYCGVIIEICNELNLRNMLEADSFFNEIYWELKEEGKLK